jgi:hypothetical protein
MDLLACALLRRENRRLQLQLAFTTIQNVKPYRTVNLSFRDQQGFTSFSNSAPSVELGNRELYLGYM